ncbi:MAG: 30S ribosomal protein S8 [Parcubacteria group bacterium]|jgi:small subunit ribosomal protein S8
MLDPISDMLTRIRNANLAGHSDVLVPFSRFKMKIAEILAKSNFVEKATTEEVDLRKYVKIELRYSRNEKGEKAPFIQGLRRVSRQGQRIYAGKKKLSVVRSGFGFSIVSTSRGLMTGEEAKKTGVGGEIICEIW